MATHVLVKDGDGHRAGKTQEKRPIAKQMEEDGGSGGTTESGDKPAPKVRKVRKADRDLWKLVSLLSKRKEALAVLMDSIIGPQDRGEIKVEYEPDLSLSQKVQGRGQGQGSRRVWIDGGLLDWLVQSINADNTPEEEIKALMDHLAEYGNLDLTTQECNFWRQAKPSRQTA